jgi:hypothetical protein
MNFALLPEDIASVPHQWFEAQLSRHPKDVVHKICLEAEVAALEDFHDCKTNIDEAAKAITYPISNSSIQDLGGYSDDAIALCHLWNLVINALIEWPSSRTPDLVGLLSAMSKVTDPIHWGQLLNDHDEYQCPWSQLPYLTMYWRDDFWMTPGQISRRVTDAAGRSHARAVHVKQQDVEAQLVAAGIFKCKLQILRSISRRTFTVSIQSQFRDCARSPNRSLISALTEWFCTGKRPLQYIIRTLETVPDPHDDIDAAGDGEAEFQLKLDLQIPAVANWIRHNGQRL